MRKRLTKAYSHKVLGRVVVSGILEMDWIEPLEQGVINTKSKVSQIPDRVSQIADQITLWADFVAVPVKGDFGRPVAEAFVMLAGDDHIPERPQNPDQLKIDS